MELCCTTRALSTPSLQTHHRLFPNTPRLQFNHSVSLKHRTHFLGALSHTSTLLRAASSDESSSGGSNSSGEKTDSIATLEDVPSAESNINLDGVSPVNQTVYNETRQEESSENESPSDNPMQPLNELLDKFDINLESEDSYTIFLYGGGALVALWLLTAVVGAIDSIPVFPKLMEVVGLGYSLWFTTRYLLFKRNREELGSKIEELKREVLGSGDN